MKLTSREYQPGDEVYINKLYKLITNRDRTIQEYEWEWVNTWDGQSSIWLLFDEDRKENDRLIGQYSLIPTPFSFWEKSYLAGKTENCMSHPDYRGKGIYFPHEQKYFEEAKKRFQLFFTTTGNVAKGAPGAVRRKLGYVALDSWVYYVFFINNKYPQNLLLSRLKSIKKIPISLAKCLSAFVSYVFAFYFKLFLPLKPSDDVRIFNKNEVPLDEIESFWNRNKTSYMITVDRQSAYLAWRINQNPYYDYKYLLHYKENKLVGYAIVSLNKNNVCVIEDIIVENKDMVIFDTIISHLIWYAKELGADAVSCSTLTGNTILKTAFRKKKFIDLETLRKIIENKERLKAFHVYVSSEIESKQNPLDPQSWYITDLVSEGRS